MNDDDCEKVASKKSQQTHSPTPSSQLCSVHLDRKGEIFVELDKKIGKRQTRMFIYSRGFVVCVNRECIYTVQHIIRMTLRIGQVFHTLLTE